MTNKDKLKEIKEKKIFMNDDMENEEKTIQGEIKNLAK